MVTTTEKTPGRNEPCPCGSGLKYKKCCGKKVNRDLTYRDIVKCLFLLLEGAAESNLAIPEGPIPFSKKMLDDVPDDLVKEILVAENANFLTLTVKKKKDESVIIQPDKKIITGITPPRPHLKN